MGNLLHREPTIQDILQIELGITIAEHSQNYGGIHH